MAVAHDAGKRRLIYGLNTLVALVAAVALVVLVNWLVASQLDRVPPGLSAWLRYDLTATRRHSLSETTRNTLDTLEGPHEAVTLMVEDDPRNQAVRDLLTEYQRVNPDLGVRHVRLGLDITAEEDLFGEVTARFDDEIGEVRNAIDQGMQSLEQAINRLGAIHSQLEAASQDARVPEAQRVGLRQLAVDLTNGLSRLSRMQEVYVEALDQPLPDYGRLTRGQESLRERLRQAQRDVVQPAQVRLLRTRDTLRRSQTNSEAVLRALNLIESLEADLDATIQQLAAVRSSQGYNQATSRLGAGPCVVLFSPDKVRVLSVDRMFPQSDAEGESADPSFLGEAMVSSALLGMRLDPPPRVVFATNGGTRALGEQGQYLRMTQRLRSLDVEVREWQLFQRTGDPSQPYPLDPGLERADGQRVVYVFLPFEEVDRDGSASVNVNQQRDRYLGLLSEKLASDDGVMLQLRLTPENITGLNPIADLCRPYGIVPVLHQMVLREAQVSEDVTQSSSDFRFERWPSDHPITRSLDGVPGYMRAAPPLLLPDAAEGVERAALVELTDPSLWVLEDIEEINTGSVEYDPSRARASAAVAAAGERDTRRLVVTTALRWAEDETTGYGMAGPGTADYAGQAFPANGELFVNSLLWLAELDELIAAGPRSQDLRRIEPMSDGRLLAYRVVLGGLLPAGVLAFGAGVWSLRRRR